MKFAFFGYDHTMDIALRLITEGHQLVHIFTFSCDNVFSFNTEIKDFAFQNQIPLSKQPADIATLEKLIEEKECKLLLSAGYPHKIPTVDHSKCYSINFHPSYLPKARGIMPLPYTIIEDSDAAGFTIHKHSPEYDEGDILYQKKISIDEHTDIETLAARIAVHAPMAAVKVVNEIEDYWKNAKPQDNSQATYYDKPSEQMRSINWSDNVPDIIRKSKAFGRFGIIAEVSNNIGQSQKLAVFNLSGWQEDHSNIAGVLLRSSPREIIVTTTDGYICLKEFQVIPDSSPA